MDDVIEQPRLITPLEAAARLAIDKVSKSPHKEILKMGRRGEIETRRVGRWTMVVESSLNRLITTGKS